MRILFVSHSFPLRGDPGSNVGGMQRVATGLHAALREHPGVHLSSLLLETTWKATPYRMPRYMAGLLRSIPRVVRDEEIDVVLFSSMVTASLLPALAPALRRHGTLAAAIPHGRDVTLPTPPYQWLVPRVFRALDLVLPNSRATGRECLKRGLAPHRMHVVPCGVDPEAFRVPRNRTAARRALLDSLGARAQNISDETLLLCSVGRHQERKGFQWFVDQVMPRLPRDVHYLMTGEGPMTGRIRAAVERHGLENVHMLGSVSEEFLRTVYGGSDLFVMPNVPVPGDMEGFGVVMLEGGLAGMPAVAANLEGISDVVREGENGHLVESRNPEAFEAAILAYRGNRARLADASRRTEEYTRRHFSWPAIADRHVRILRGALGRDRRGPAAVAFDRAAG